MMSLRELQTRFKAHLLHGDGSIADSVIRTSPEDGDERLGVYGFAYGQRLREALRIEFPGLAALLGDDAFPELLNGYLRAYPSRQPNVRWLGRDLAQWLATDSDQTQHPERAAMARLDWALSTSFDAPDIAPIDATSTAAVLPEQWAGLRFAIHPAVQTMPLEWNIDEIRLAIGAEENRAPELQAINPCTIVVWRKNFGVRYRRMDVDEATAFNAVTSDASFGDVCGLLCEWHEVDGVAARAVYLLQRWFAADWIVELRAPEKGVG
ncbi:MAG: DNA-binding domain-containing protein [Dokdonella sp.]